MTNFIQNLIKNLFKCRACTVYEEEILRNEIKFDTHRRDLLDQIDYLRKIVFPVQQVNSEIEPDINMEPIRGHKSARVILSELGRHVGKTLEEKQKLYKQEVTHAK